MKPEYRNARSVLPRRLLRQVQERQEGCLLWIPPRKKRHLKTKVDERLHRRIRKARAEGMSLRAIAERFKRAPSRIWEICRSVQIKSKQNGQGR